VVEAVGGEVAVVDEENVHAREIREQEGREGREESRLVCATQG
jgi:hypothetical protein